MKLADSRQQPFQIRNSSRGLDTSSSSPLLTQFPRLREPQSQTSFNLESDPRGRALPGEFCAD